MKNSLLAVLIGFIITGCGGGGSNESASTPPPVTEAKPVVAQGSINRVDYNNNTIEVNGHTYMVERVEYGIQPLSITTLKPNMIVEVAMMVKSGAVVSVEPTIVGSVSSIHPDRKSFMVNGVTLAFTLDPQIELGDWVMVSSLPQATADGLGYKVLSVIKIEQEDVAGQYEIEGRLSELDQNTKTFKLGTSTKVLFSPDVIEDNAVLKNGQWVEVKGQMVNNEFTAAEVEVETYDGSDNDHEIEGIVTWVNSSKTEFELNARGRFVVNAQTRFEDGNKNHLVSGELVEVTAVNRVAKEIEFENDFGGENFYLDAYTEFDDLLTVNTLNGQYVDIEGVIIDGKYVVREIERENG